MARYKYFFSFSIVLLLCPLLTVADDLTPGERTTIRDRQADLIEEQRRRISELQEPANQTVSETPAINPDESCTQITHIELIGASILSAKEQRDLVKPFERACLGETQLKGLLEHIAQYYADRGYISSGAYLPEQEANSSVLTVQVVEGRLQSLIGNGLATDRELAMTSPIGTGDLINQADLQQLIDQLARLPSRQLELEILSGAEPGLNSIGLQGTRDKPWRISLGRDNGGDKSTGEQQWSTYFDWDSPLGFADQLTLYASEDAVSDHWRHSDSQGASYSLPYAWWTFSYDYNQSYFRSRSEGGFLDLPSDGDTQTHTLTAERVLLRNNTSSTAVSFAVNHDRTRNYINDNFVDVYSYRFTELSLGLNHGRRIGYGFANIDLGWQKGSGALDAEEEVKKPSGALPVSHFNKYTASISYFLPFTLWGEVLEFNSLATGQRSEDVLYGVKRISIGGLSSVRGYKEQSISGDSGGYWRNQLEWTRPVTAEALHALVTNYRISLAYDQGVIRHAEYNTQHGRLTGQAVDLAVSGPYLSASVTFSNSLKHPDGIEAESPLYFSVTLNY